MPSASKLLEISAPHLQLAAPRSRLDMDVKATLRRRFQSTLGTQLSENEMRELVQMAEMGTEYIWDVVYVFAGKYVFYF
jgi:hypothetical protein